METRADRALNLIQEGYPAKEIVEILGYANTTSVFNLAKSHGLKVAKAHDGLHEQMRKYKAEGHTMNEVALKFNVCKATAQHICKGIAPQDVVKGRFSKGNPSPNKGILQDIENVKSIITERAPGFEFAGNYTGSNGKVDLRCKKCGHIHTHNWHNVRNKGVKYCPNCLEIERKQHAVEQAKQREYKLQEKECNKRGAAVVKLLKHAIKLHKCPVCGKITDNKKYCSRKCCQKANEAKKEAARRIRIQSALVDKDISLERLYKRDNGVCHICGGKCNWNDSTYKGNYFIAGKTYPSIDHVIPLSLGGEHSWQNVKLAHFACNSAKGAKYCG